MIGVAVEATVGVTSRVEGDTGPTVVVDTVGVAGGVDVDTLVELVSSSCLGDEVVLFTPEPEVPEPELEPEPELPEPDPEPEPELPEVDPDPLLPELPPSA